MGTGEGAEQLGIMSEKAFEGKIMKKLRNTALHFIKEFVRCVLCLGFISDLENSRVECGGRSKE